jgi:hypothetical protein
MYLHVIFHMPSSSGSLVITVKLQAVCSAAIMLLHSVQKTLPEQMHIFQ